MALKIGNNAVANAFVGSSQVRRAYKGGTLVFQAFSPASEQEFIQQEATGGPAQLLKVYGKTIVNNQLVKNGDFSGTTSWNAIGGTISAADGVLSFAVTSAPTSAYSLRLRQNIASVAHKYCVLYDILPPHSTATLIDLNNNSQSVTIQGGIWNSVGIIHASTGGSSSFGLWLDAQMTSAAGDIIKVRKVRIIDLTLLYGAGNEPTSVAQFEADYPEYDPAYDPGSLQSNKTAELRAYDGGTLRGSLALNLSTLTGKLNGEGASVVVFPDGLRGVGTDRDAAYGSTGEVARAVVDLGTLNWSYCAVSSSYPYGFFSTSLADYTKTDDTFLLTAKYSFVRGGWAVDKTIRGGDNGSHSVYIIDSAYTDPATFKTAMSGVMLEYPLATPLAYTLDTPLPTDLTCEQGDILQRVSDNNCPFVGEMKFGL